MIKADGYVLAMLCIAGSSCTKDNVSLFSLLLTSKFSATRSKASPKSISISLYFTRVIVDSNLFNGLFNIHIDTIKETGQAKELTKDEINSFVFIFPPIK